MAWASPVFIYFLAITFAAAQLNLTPNPAWRNTNITVSPEERITIAQGAIETTLSNILDGNGQMNVDERTFIPAARFFSQMADFDRFTNQTIYKDKLLSLFPQVENYIPNFAHGNINWRLEYAIAAGHAYVAYSDSRFLDWAQTAWDSGRSYTLTEDELDTGKIFGKNITMKKVCGNLTMAGGTFWRNVTNEGFLNALSTGTYLSATSLLAEITKNHLFVPSAYTTETFYFNHLRNAEGDMLDGINGDTCIPHDGTFPANEGLMIEGIAVLASVTKAANLSDHLLEILNKTISNTGWHTEEGILSADSTTQASAEHVGQFVVRGLSAIYQRNTTHSTFRETIRQYLSLQYNAVLSNAQSTGDDHNIYSASWTGPPSATEFDFQNQTNAMSILVAAIPIQDSDLDPTVEGGPTATGVHSPASHPPNIGAIIGGVLGGLALVSLLLVAGLYLLRRHHKSTSSMNKSPVQANVNPNDPENVPPRPQKRLSPVLFEKNRSPPAARASLPATSITFGSGATSDSSGWTPSSPNPELFRFGSNVPTAELVRILNERLQPGASSGESDEPPPDYASHQQ